MQTMSVVGRELNQDYLTTPDHFGMQNRYGFNLITLKLRLYFKTYLVTTEVTPLKSCRIEGYTKCRRMLIDWFW